MSQRESGLRRFFVLLPTIVTALALADYLPDRARGDEGAAYRDGLIMLAGVSLALQVGSGLWVWPRLARLYRLRRPGAIAALVIVPAVGIGATTLFEGLGLIGADRLALRTSALVTGAFVFSLWMLGGCVGGYERGGVQRLAMLIASTFLSFVLLEGVFVAWNSIRPMPLLIGESGARATLDRYRSEGGASYRGSRLNPEGYFDGPFLISRDQDAVGVVLADSFGRGIVPRGRNFVDVAEARLTKSLRRPISLDNRGVPGIGIPEYAWILENEVMPGSVRTVVVCLFPTNDLWSVRDRRRHRASLSNWLVLDVMRGALARLRLAIETGPSDPSPLLTTNSLNPASPASLFDTALLPPTFPPDEYLRIEGDRLRAADPSNRSVTRQIAQAVEVLNAMRIRSDAPLRVVLIPDEFQVSDALHTAVVDRFPEYQGIDRDATYLELKTRLIAAGYSVLDLLGPLREGEREAATYHPRDTHWNEAGNRIAGEALGRFLEGDFQ